MSRPLRISAISYLNTAPLMWDFRHGHPGFDISYTVPSQCAAELGAGSADIGIIPAAAYVNIPDLVIIPGVAIASKAAVRSILLVSKVPLEKIQIVALDNFLFNIRRAGSNSLCEMVGREKRLRTRQP